jgi:XTP/dITP diphosphohydrolase
VTGADPHPGLSRIIAVMDRLRSPGGCEWDAEQTHASLAEYLVEETYELLEAIDADDRRHLREELGDVLLQVVFHSRIAQDHPRDPFGIDEVADGIADKLVRRHPHVFAGEDAPGKAAAGSNWEATKAAEKGRRGVLDGVPANLPPLTAAGKIRYRAGVAGLAAAVPPPAPDSAGAPADAEDVLGDDLLRQVLAAYDGGLDPERALRGAIRRARARVELGRAAHPDAPDAPGPGAAPEAGAP